MAFNRSCGDDAERSRVPRAPRYTCAKPYSREMRRGDPVPTALLFAIQGAGFSVIC